MIQQKHPNGHFSQIQLAVGYLLVSSGIPFCDFVVYNFKALILIIIRTKFDELYYHKNLNKLNTFYKDYMLPKICESDQ